jgi:hypothetical protein
MARRKDPLIEAPAEALTETAEVADEVKSVVMAEQEPVQPPPLPAAPSRQSGILGPLLGGAMAAMGGFALAYFDVLGFAAPDRSEEIQAFDQRLAALEGAGNTAEIEAVRMSMDALAERLSVLEAAPAEVADLSGLEERLAAIEAMPVGSDASTAALAARLAELERRLAAAPAGVDQAEVDAALKRLEDAEAEAAARAEEAAAAAAAAEAAAALDRLRDAVEAGTAFEAELAAVDPALQAALAPYVAGVPTLEALQAGFPEAARAALQLDRAATEEGWGARFMDFLAAQTGARSLTPREGTDADAVLSRAEFALSEGRLADAVVEVKALEPAVQAPFADWLATADARIAALAALEGK